MRAVKRDRSLPDSDAAEREFGAGELGPGRKRRRHGGRSHINRGQRPLGGLEFADEKLATRPDQAGVERVGGVAEPVERLGGRIEFVHRPGQIARGQRDLGLGDLATGLGEAFASAKAARGAAEELARSFVVAELGHRNAAQSESRRVFAQRDALERTERITSHQQSSRRGDEGVHGGKLSWGASGRRTVACV
jgi:hypothetical protein